MSHARVVICQRRLTHYRVPLFELMRARLDKAGVELLLVHGQPDPVEEGKRDSGYVSWANVVRNKYFRFRGKFLCWQPRSDVVRDADLVVITQENSLISNVPWMLGWGRRSTCLAFWGHGANLQSRHRTGARERFKRWTTGRVDWWFAYTEMSAELVGRAGFDRGRITVLNNSIDTSELRGLRFGISSAELESVRVALGLGEATIGLFLGSLYADKRLDFLFEAARRIKQRIPDFCLLIIGDGPEREFVRQGTRAYPWIRWVGALRGRDKVLHAATSSVMLNPGLVGLGVLDSFALGVPMVTTQWPFHSPEVSYLVSGLNGLVVADDVDVFVEEVCLLLSNPNELQRMKEECFRASEVYSIEAMADRFCTGILDALRSREALNGHR